DSGPFRSRGEEAARVLARLEEVAPHPDRLGELAGEEEGRATPGAHRERRCAIKRPGAEGRPRPPRSGLLPASARSAPAVRAGCRSGRAARERQAPPSAGARRRTPTDGTWRRGGGRHRGTRLPSSAGAPAGTYAEGLLPPPPPRGPT